MHSLIQFLQYQFAMILLFTTITITLCVMPKYYRAAVVYSSNFVKNAIGAVPKYILYLDGQWLYVVARSLDSALLLPDIHVFGDSSPPVEFVQEERDHGHK